MPFDDPFPPSDLPPCFPKSKPEVVDDRPVFGQFRPPTAKEAMPDDTLPYRPVVRLPVASTPSEPCRCSKPATSSSR